MGLITRSAAVSKRNECIAESLNSTWRIRATPDGVQLTPEQVRTDLAQMQHGPRTSSGW